VTDAPGAAQVESGSTRHRMRQPIRFALAPPDIFRYAKPA
jgi:hypothetical protein